MKSSVRITKRCIDLVISTVGLIIVAPLFPLIAIVLYIESPGPIFIKQRRAGRLLSNTGGQLVFEEFDVRKFRSMCVDAERYVGPVLAAEDDPRITRVGGFLRKTRLDELPQLWSVFIGQMSLVGPRPERPELLQDLACAIPLFEERMRGVKPGVTGLAQVSLGYNGRPDRESEVGRHTDSLTNPFHLDAAKGALADDMRIKLLYDMAYLATLERFWLFLGTELKILVRTPWVMMRGLGR